MCCPQSLFKVRKRLDGLRPDARDIETKLPPLRLIAGRRGRTQFIGLHHDPLASSRFPPSLGPSAAVWSAQRRRAICSRAAADCIPRRSCSAWNRSISSSLSASSAVKSASASRRLRSNSRRRRRAPSCRGSIRRAAWHRAARKQVGRPALNGRGRRLPPHAASRTHTRMCNNALCDLANRRCRLPKLV